MSSKKNVKPAPDPKPKPPPDPAAELFDALEVVSGASYDLKEQADEAQTLVKHSQAKLEYCLDKGRRLLRGECKTGAAATALIKESWEDHLAAEAIRSAGGWKGMQEKGATDQEIANHLNARWPDGYGSGGRTETTWVHRKGGFRSKNYNTGKLHDVRIQDVSLEAGGSGGYKPAVKGKRWAGKGLIELVRKVIGIGEPAKAPAKKPEPGKPAPKKPAAKKAPSKLKVPGGWKPAGGAPADSPTQTDSTHASARPAGQTQSLGDWTRNVKRAMATLNAAYDAGRHAAEAKRLYDAGTSPAAAAKAIAATTVAAAPKPAAAPAKEEKKATHAPAPVIKYVNTLNNDAARGFAWHAWSWGAADDGARGASPMDDHRDLPLFQKFAIEDRLADLAADAGIEFRRPSEGHAAAAKSTKQAIAAPAAPAPAPAEQTIREFFKLTPNDGDGAKLLRESYTFDRLEMGRIKRVLRSPDGRNWAVTGMAIETGVFVLSQVIPQAEYPDTPVEWKVRKKDAGRVRRDDRLEGVKAVEDDSGAQWVFLANKVTLRK